MEYEAKVRWLRRYRSSLREEQELAEELEQLRAEAERITPLYTDTPGGHGSSNKMGKAVERIVETQQRLQQQIKHAQAVRAEIETVVAAIPNDRAREILRRRYIQGQRWEEIACKMHMDCRWVTRLHRRSVEEMKGEC